MAVFRFVVVFLVAAVLKDVHAITEDEKIEIRSKLLPIVTDCAKEFGVSLDTLKASKEAHSIEGIDTCFMACVMKKSNIMSDDGKFDVDAAEEKSKTFLSSEDDLKQASEVTKSCASVNDEAVSDGDKGCDRAKLLAVCLIEHKHHFLP